MLAEAILRHAKAPSRSATQRVEPSVCIGIAIGDRRTDPSELPATRARQWARRRRKGAIGTCSRMPRWPTRRDTAGRRTPIREALDDDRFLPYFQPVVDLGTGEMTGYEALVRTVGEDGGDRAAVALHADRRASPVIADIDMTMLRRGLAALARLPEP